MKFLRVIFLFTSLSVIAACHEGHEEHESQPVAVNSLSVDMQENRDEFGREKISTAVECRYKEGQLKVVAYEFTSDNRFELAKIIQIEDSVDFLKRSQVMKTQEVVGEMPPVTYIIGDQVYRSVESTLCSTYYDRAENRFSGSVLCTGMEEKSGGTAFMSINFDCRYQDFITIEISKEMLRSKLD